MNNVTTRVPTSRNGRLAVGCGGLLALFLVCGICNTMLGGSQPATPMPPTAAPQQFLDPVTEAPATDTARPTATEEEATATDQPTAAPTDQPTAIPPTAAPTQPPAPTAAPQPTAVPPTSAPQPLIQAPPPAQPGARSGQPQGSACPPELPVKGNQGSNGWIYHVPGGNNYDQTKPEECFATAADAEAAGYRAPRR